MKEKQIKVRYLITSWNEQKWEGSIKDAMDIALSEIHEHTGGASAAYLFTKAIFNEIKKEAK